MKTIYNDHPPNAKYYQIIVFQYNSIKELVYHRIGFAKRISDSDKEDYKESSASLGVWNVAYKDPVTLETIKNE